jgi:hypothetical protein
VNQYDSPVKTIRNIQPRRGRQQLDGCSHDRTTPTKDDTSFQRHDEQEELLLLRAVMATLEEIGLVDRIRYRNTRFSYGRILASRQYAAVS